MIAVIVLFAVKEFLMALLGYLAIRKKDSVNSAKWYGKANTVFLYIVLILLILFPDMSEFWANVLIISAGCVMLLSLLCTLGSIYIFYRIRE